MTIEKNNFVDNAEDHENWNYFKKFNTLFKGKVQKNLLNWCIYSISKNDPAHDLEHVLNVCKVGLEIFYHYSDVYDFSERDELILMHGCLMHDLGCKYNRKDHHLIGYGLVYEYINSQCPGIFKNNEIALIARCVLEHRSSNKKRPTTKLSEIVSIADSGIPNVGLYVKRAVIFRLSNKNVVNSLESIQTEVFEHLTEKFGSNGYHWNSYPELGKRWYKDEWEVFKQLLKDKSFIDSLSKDYYEKYKDKY